MTDLVASLSRVILESSETVFRSHGFCPQPQVHFLAEDLQQPYIGSVTCRRFYRGADAASAVADLGLFPSVIGATRLLVVWEDRDLRTALELPDAPSANGVVILDAGIDRHTLNWHPFEAEAGDIGPLGIPTVIPHWGTTARYEDAPVLAPITDLLRIWREFRRDDIRETGHRLEEAGYEFQLIEG